MLLPIAGLILGALAGALAAKRRGGKTADIVQWAAVWAIAFGALGVFFTVIAVRLLG